MESKTAFRGVKIIDFCSLESKDYCRLQPLISVGRFSFRISR